MTRGSKEKYTEAQKNKAQHIEESYEAKGVSTEEAEARAWATVNKQSGGGEKSGGSGKKTPEHQKKTARSDSAKQAAQTRGDHVHTSQSSMATETKQSLLKKARSENIKGRSTMSKAELVKALSAHK